ncbi:hypothetical protein ACN47E_004814 [Coniothyrium glycines]
MTDFRAWIEKNKALWTRVYDEVITPDLEEEWKKRDEAHGQELRKKEENQQHLFEHLNNEIIAKAHLVRENEELKQELRQHISDDAASSGGIVTSGSAATVLSQEFKVLAEQYAELNKKYQDLSQKAKYLEKKNASVMQKNKDMKDNVRAWQEYADRQIEKQKHRTGTKVDDARLRLPAEDYPPLPSSPRSVVTTRSTPQFRANLENSSPVPATHSPQPLAAMTNRRSTPRSVDGDDGERAIDSGTPNAPDHVEHDERTFSNKASLGHPCVRLGLPNSSQTTVDEPAAETRNHVASFDAADDDDSPQFISERQLKRKRVQPSKSRFEIYTERSSDGTPVRPFRVKEEQHSSPPRTNTRLARTETFDLDSPTTHALQTPHHDRRLPCSHSTSTGIVRHQRSGSAPLCRGIKPEGTGANARDHLLRPACAVAIPVDVRAFSEPSDPTLLEDTVLHSLDPNIASSGLEEPPMKRSRKSISRRKERYEMLTESGETVFPMETESRLPPSAARAQLNRRVLTPRSPNTPAASSSHTHKAETTKVKTEQPKTPSLDIARSNYTSTDSSNDRTSKLKSRSRPRDDLTPSGPIWTMRATAPRPSAQKVRSMPSKQQGQLKDKSWTELSLQDFRPNPAYNQGYTYAFSETVRNRADRLCLPGCTNAQCCGSTFRILAEAQAPLPASQEQALLEEYLGNAYNNIQLTQMSSEERKELVLQARTKKMAKESGKHREAYERRKTPPGFWRIDFPTTQEQEEDKERAKEQERAEIQQRWLEAHRKGGRWIFRDE